MPSVHVASSVASAERSLVEIDDLACGYDGRAVLERIALSLAPGQFAGIVGPSGSGKTTVLRAILGLADVYHGAVRFPSAANGRRPRHRCDVGDPGSDAGFILERCAKWCRLRTT